MLIYSSDLQPKYFAMKGKIVKLSTSCHYRFDINRASTHRKPQLQEQSVLQPCQMASFADQQTDLLQFHAYTYIHMYMQSPLSLAALPT